MSYLYIVLGAVAGAPLRYFVSTHAQRLGGEAFPWGTLAVNLAGCLAIGFIFGLAEERVVSREARLLLVTGFLGSFTTFSAFGWETHQLIRDGSLGLALLNAAGSVVLGLVAVWGGFVAGRAT